MTGDDDEQGERLSSNYRKGFLSASIAFVIGGIFIVLGILVYYSDQVLFDALGLAVAGSLIIILGFIFIIIGHTASTQPETRNICFWNDCDDVVERTRELLREHEVRHREYTFVEYSQLGRNELARAGVTSKMKIGIFDDGSEGRIFETEDRYRIIQVQDLQVGKVYMTHVQMWPPDDEGNHVFDIIEDGLRGSLDELKDMTNPPDWYEHRVSNGL